ncbi:MAG: P-II family nitrogen regulator [Acidobacteria bacterium]|nr:MAG: P-II family nitrogen regulator [Acidobacteriota bacterium]MCE7956396.1 P-II family nitrogen regulator [Acidobacteria bacterium ACB2]
MKEIKAIVQPFMADQVIDRLHRLPHLPGLVVSTVHVFSRCDCTPAPCERTEESKMTKIELVVLDDMVEEALSVIAQAGHTGNCGDGKVFVCGVTDVLRIRTGVRGEAAV